MSDAESELEETMEQVFDQQADGDGMLATRLNELRERAASLSADIAARNRRIAAELRDAAPHAFDWPEPLAADEWEDPLFDSQRDYVEQIDRYKQHQGKPIARQERK